MFGISQVHQAWLSPSVYSLPRVGEGYPSRHTNFHLRRHYQILSDEKQRENQAYVFLGGSKKWVWMDVLPKCIWPVCWIKPPGVPPLPHVSLMPSYIPMWDLIIVLYKLKIQITFLYSSRYTAFCPKRPLKHLSMPVI